MPDIVGSRLAPLTIWLLAFVLAATVGSGTGACVSSGATLCGDLRCPAGRACVSETCVDQAVVTACAGALEADECSLPESGIGTCHNGLCIIGTCGDGTINAIDACDGADLANKTCLDFGSTSAAGLACTADCAFDTTLCTAFCGDGVRDSAEECDGDDFGVETCISKGFYSGRLACENTCKLNLNSCRGTCGDGVHNGLEQCDGSDFGVSTCEARGFPGAVSPLLCDAACGFAESSCTCGGILCTPRTQRCVVVDDIPTCEAI
jgi:hypothetical protein